MDADAPSTAIGWSSWAALMTSPACEPAYLLPSFSPTAEPCSRLPWTEDHFICSKNAGDRICEDYHHRNRKSSIVMVFAPTPLTPCNVIVLVPMVTCMSAPRSVITTWVLKLAAVIPSV